MTTEVMNTYEAIKEHFENLDDSDLIQAHNTYCDENYYEGRIYDNDEEFFNIFFDGKVMDAIRAAHFGEYNYSDNYVKFNGLANLESFDYPSQVVDIDEIVSDAQEYPERYDIELIEEQFECDVCGCEWDTEDEANECCEDIDE